MNLKIERNVPVPPSYRGAAATMREALKEMEIGDSFVLTSAIHYHAVYRVARDLGIAITARKIPGEGWRVWKVGTKNQPETALHADGRC